MDKIFAVSLPRIQRNSAEYLNKLDNSAFVYSINLNILSSSAAADVSLTNSLIEYISSLKQHK
ncbi:hypothetical protein [Prevotella herbatica]|uniref:hypothetical protein n=1 Tax=Prevotella herbatica TaxID=2801997 RepID=UPI001A91FDAF|nr:hypothetical protein [Prevotella herbatica]